MRQQRTRFVHWLRRLVVLLVLTAAAGVAAGQANTDALVASLFGQELKAVKDTEATADDVALAGQMLALAGECADAPSLLEGLCRGAYDLTADAADGGEVADRAMALLARRRPGKALEARQLTVAMWRRRRGNVAPAERLAAGEALVDALLALADAQGRAGDLSGATQTLTEADGLVSQDVPSRQPQVSAAREHMKRRREADTKAATYRDRLRNNADDQEARRELVQLFVVAMDDPQGAQEYVAGLDDEILRTYVPLAAADPGELDPAAVLELGLWYQHLGSHSSGAGKEAMLARAQTYLESAVARCRGSLRRQALRSRADIAGQLALAGGEEMVVDRPYGLVSQVDLARDARAGVWRHSAAGLLAGESPGGSLVFPVVVKGSYDLRMKLVRHTGEGPVTVILPVGDRSVLLVIDAKGITGLSNVGGRDVLTGNATRVDTFSMPTKKPVQMTVKVEDVGGRLNVSVVATGGLAVNWSGDLGQLSLPGSAEPIGVGRIAIGVRDTSASFEDISLRVISGSARRAGGP